MVFSSAKAISHSNDQVDCVEEIEGICFNVEGVKNLPKDNGWRSLGSERKLTVVFVRVF
jgi:hypothetical protein